MKSIMQEASSIAQAIEKGWERAGKPHDFSVKIFEEPVKNFIGFTTKPAKVGIFFHEPSMAGRDVKVRPEVSQKPPKPKSYERKDVREKKYEQPMRPLYGKQEEVKQEKITPQFVKKEEQESVLWNDHMIQLAKEWMQEALVALNLSHISFDTSADRYYLKLTFHEPLNANNEKEKQLFRSYSFLMIQALKRKLKRPLRGFKIILTRN